MVMSDGELSEVGAWSKKAQNSKGGFVTHEVHDMSGHKKMCCEKMMGEKCGCPGPFTKGKKKQ